MLDQKGAEGRGGGACGVPRWGIPSMYGGAAWPQEIDHHKNNNDNSLLIVLLMIINRTLCFGWKISVGELPGILLSPVLLATTPECVTVKIARGPRRVQVWKRALLKS